MVEKAEQIMEKTEAAAENIESTDGDNIKKQPEIDSKYRMIILAAQRSKQLQRGATPRVELDLRKTKPTRIALKEIENGRINFETLTEN